MEKIIGSSKPTGNVRQISILTNFEVAFDQWYFDDFGENILLTENVLVLLIRLQKEFDLIVYLLAGFTYEEKVFKILQCTKSDNINALWYECN